jgi:hypothetical protein
MKNKQIYSESTRRETVSVANTLKNQNVNLPMLWTWILWYYHLASDWLKTLSPCHTVALIFTGSFFFTIQSYFSRLTISFNFAKWPNIYIKDQLNILTEPGLRLDQNQFRCILPLQYSVITYVMLTGRYVCIKRSQSCREEKWIALI